jgi:hypothetical protein
VDIAVKAGRGNDVEAGLARHLDEAVQVAAEAERRPVDERAAACGDQRPGLLDCLVAVEKLLARLRGVSRNRCSCASHGPKSAGEMSPRTVRMITSGS